jgi:hypothetical protein
MPSICRRCATTLALTPDGKPPPWCPACGADLKSCLVQIADADAPVVLSAKDKAEWKDRFGTHNVAVGILLFIWGLVVSAGPPQNGGEKVLRAEERLGTVIDVVQVVTLINGVALAVSGVALRRGWRWGYPLAIGCGIVLIVAGFTFLAGFHHLKGGPFLEHGVAKITFVRQNLDMLIGLVDGLGLLWFVSTRVPALRQSTPA